MEKQINKLLSDSVAIASFGINSSQLQPFDMFVSYISENKLFLHFQNQTLKK